MKINGISSNINLKNLKNISSKQVTNPQYNVSFEGDTTKRVTAATLAALAGVGLAGCGSQAETTTPPTFVEQEFKDQVIDNIGSSLDIIQNGRSDKILLTDINLFSLPVSEFYLPSVDNRTVINPNSQLPRNNQGTVIVTITEKSSDEMNEGNTLGEIVSKVYSDELSNYEGEEYTAVFNKLIDEVVQANPSLSAYVQKELGDNADSYEDVANLNLYKGSSSVDQTLDTRLLTIPTVVSWQVQGKEPNNYSSFYTSSTYAPKSDSASVIDGGSNLMNGEYKSFVDMILGEYGKDISDEAYRDIVYGVVNDPRNAHHFEKVLDDMNFYDIIKTGNIHDLNRTLEANVDGTLIGVSLPTVNTFRTNATADNKNDGSKNLIIYQISPAAVKDGQNDRQILIINNTNKNGKMSAGDVFMLKDVLQFYSSPDGNGRFANVENGKLVMNSDVNYQEDFATNILQQVVYANLPIFTAEYEDENGIHPYGVFDVNEGYDTKGKTLEQIIQNSTINFDRMMNFSFVDDKGVSKFEDGVELNLPQFNYRLNQTKSETKPSVPTEPTETEPTETVPTETEPTETEPTETEPTETEPTETEPTETVPTETEPTETVPTETEPTETEPTETEPTETVPTETEPTETVPTETEPTETEPTETEPTETVPTETEPTETEPTETEPTETVPTETEPTETVPTETEPTETEPTETVPTETEPTETEPTCDDSSTPDVPTEEPVPTLPTETEPTETVPTETEPTETLPTETEPTETVPTETEPTETQPSATEIDPVDPTETIPTETEPTETVPTETEPTETQPSATEIDPVDPTETVPTETEPTETVPTETEPTETVPTETEPTQTEPTCDDSSTPDVPTQEPVPTLPTETEPTETVPTETEPTETVPTETEPTQTEPTCDDSPIPDEPTEEQVPTNPTESQPTETVPTQTEPTETQPTETVPTETEPTETVPTQIEPTETVPTETQPTQTEPSCDDTPTPDEPIEEQVPGLGQESDVVVPEDVTEPTQAPETQPSQTVPAETGSSDNDSDAGCGEEGEGDDYVEEQTPVSVNNIEAPAPVVENKVEAPAPKQEAPASVAENKVDASSPVFEEVVEEAVPVLQSGNKQSTQKSNDSLVVKLASFLVKQAASNKNKTKGISYNA